MSVLHLCQSNDIVSGSSLPLTEATATFLGTFSDYSFSRDRFGTMSLRLYTGAGSRDVNQPHEALAAAIDIILRNREKLTFGHYVLGNDVGIWAQGPLRGATSADGTPIHAFQFRRLSGGDREIWLSYGDGAIHGGRNLPWELSLHVLQAAFVPQSSTIKVIRTRAGNSVSICTSSFDVHQ